MLVGFPVRFSQGRSSVILIVSPMTGFLFIPACRALFSLERGRMFDKWLPAERSRSGLVVEFGAYFLI